MKKNNTLLINTVLLYILTFSNYFFNFLTVPYQTRVLGPVNYGRLGFASSLMTYFQLLLDFGFLLSATEEVARYRNDPQKISRIYTSVCWCKFALIALSGGILFVLCMTVERFQEDVLLYLLYFISVAIYSFIPDYLYRGLEQMKAITIRSVLIRLFFTLMVFVFLKKPSQYHIIPLLNIIGNFTALIGVYCHLRFSLKIRFAKISIKEAISTFKRSSIFFYSRIASSIYGATNTFILGFLYGDSSSIVGFYSSADKLVVTSKQGITPITDSLYPYMVAHKDFKMVKKILLVFMPILTIGCLVVAIWANPICALFFGKEFWDAGNYLRLLTPVIWCSFPGMLFGFPVLTPLGLSKYANLSNILGAVIQVTLLLLAYLFGILNVTNICIITCITELVIAIYRIGVAYILGRKRNHKGF